MYNFLERKRKLEDKAYQLLGQGALLAVQVPTPKFQPRKDLPTIRYS